MAEASRLQLWITQINCLDTCLDIEKKALSKKRLVLMPITTNLPLWLNRRLQEIALYEFMKLANGRNFSHYDKILLAEQDPQGLVFDSMVTHKVALLLQS